MELCSRRMQAPFIKRALARNWAPHGNHCDVRPLARRYFGLKTAKEDQKQKRMAIVTGSSRGIGEAIARRLAYDGYAVTVNDVAANQAGVEALARELNQTYGDHTSVGVIADVTSSTDVKAMVEASVKQLGPLTVMIANAGICGVGAALDTSDEQFAQTMSVNLIGVWNCYTHAARQMISQGPVSKASTGYKILGASSIAAYRPFPLLAPYCASKWAVKGMTQVFAVEMAQHDINVNCYAPGIVGTAMWEKLDEVLGEMQGRPKGETLRKYVHELTALGRVSVPEDVSKVVGFLCGPDAEFVTGQNIVVDGGIVFS